MSRHCSSTETAGGAGASGIILILALLGGISGFVNNRSQAEERQKTRTQLRQFVSQQSPALMEKRDALQSVHGDLLARVNTLQKELKALGRDPESDSDYRNWKAALSNSEEAVSRLDEKLADAYLLHRKYLLAPDPETERKVAQLLGEGLRRADSLDDEITRLQESFVTENGKEIPVRRAVLSGTIRITAVSLPFPGYCPVYSVQRARIVPIRYPRASSSNRTDSQDGR